jgi:anti-sigma B factor antagonist
MHIVVRKANNITILDLSGSLTRGEAVETLRDQVRGALKAGAANLAINLAQVSYLDSSGIGALVGALTSLEAAGAQCKFFAAPERVVQTLKTVHLEQVLDLFEDEPSALASF